MSNNGLGWLGIREITHKSRIRSLLNEVGVNIVVPIYPQPATDIWIAAAANEINGHMANPSITNYTTTYIGNEGNVADRLSRSTINEPPVLAQRVNVLNGGLLTHREDAIYAQSPPGFPPLPERAVFVMTRPIVQLTDQLARSTRNRAETALVQAKVMPKGTMPPSVGVGRSVKLTGIEILRRMHVVLGHPSLPVLLATLMASKDVNAHIITKADIEQYVREACGICESAKMRRRSFRGVTDPTPVPIGKKWVFDTMHLQAPSCLGKHIYITRFLNKLTDFPGFKRSYGHSAFTSEVLIGLCQRLRAFVRPIHGEIMIFKHDSLPAQKSKEMGDYMTEITVHDESSPPYCHEGVWGMLR